MFAKLLKASSSLSVRPSTCIEQLGYHWMEFHDIWYFCIFHKYVEKIHVSLKSDKNNGYFTWWPIYIFFIISRSFILRMINVSDKSCRRNQNTLLYSIIFSSESRAVYEIMCKNIVETDSSQMTVWHMHFACRVAKAADTLIICNCYCITTTTVVAKTLLNAYVLRYTYVHCLSYYKAN